VDPLIDEAFLQRLANLKFIVKGRRHGRLSGAHSSPRAGVSVEFSDYRDYTPGDDFRYVDWNIVGRLDRVLVKSFVHEVDLPIYILLDLSASMRLGDPPKVHYAARLAAAISYLGLRGLDRVGIYPFSGTLHASVTPRHGMRQMAHILRILRRVSPRGETSIDHALSEFAAHSHESGLVFLISDFLTPGGYDRGLLNLLHRGNEVVVVQVLDPAEIRPELDGSTRLADVENDRHLEINVGPGVLAQYERRLNAHLDRLAEFLTDHHIPYFLTPTDLPLEELIHHRWRQGGVLK